MDGEVFMHQRPQLQHVAQQRARPGVKINASRLELELKNNPDPERMLILPFPIEDKSQG